MQIVDLEERHESSYCMCLEEWSEEMREAGDGKRLWYRRMRELGLRVKLALDDCGEPGGMIQYGPIERSFAEGSGLYLVYCVWVHGYAGKGPGNLQHKGMGSALLAAAEEDARGRGAKGLAAWGILMPVFMRASWFKRHGYAVADRMGMQALLWKRFSPDAQPPKWIRPVKMPPATQGKTNVTIFRNGWCPAMNLACERAMRAAAEIGDRVAVTEIDTFEPEAIREWGQSDALFIDGRQVRTGPPPSYQKIKSIIEKRSRKHGRETRP